MEIKKTTKGGDFVAVDNSKKQEPAKKVTKKNTRPGFFKRMGMKIKDVFSELKKVSWPTFPGAKFQFCNA